MSPFAHLTNSQTISTNSSSFPSDTTSAYSLPEESQDWLANHLAVRILSGTVQIARILNYFSQIAVFEIDCLLAFFAVGGVLHSLLQITRVEGLD